jgi:hypothetical protein
METKRIDFSVLLIGLAILTIFALSSCGRGRTAPPMQGNMYNSGW